MANTVGIKRFDFVEFYVGSSKMVAYWFCKGMGFKLKAYMGPETGARDRCSYYLVKNKVKMVVTSHLSPNTSDIIHFTNHHGDGVKRWAADVKNVNATYEYAIKHGAIPVLKPTKREDDFGYTMEAAIRVYDDTEFYFINYDNYKGLFKPGYGEPVFQFDDSHEDSGLLTIDHVVGNVRVKEMDRWAEYYNTALDMETYVDFGPGDITTKYSALLSKVVRTKDSIIKLPINEPYDGIMKSQIQEYIEEYKGSGVQHIAITTADICKTVRAMRNNGIEFLNVPKTYFDKLRKKNIALDENIDDLAELGVLCDTTEDQGYLLQLFTKPIGDRPTFFFEVIQRKNGAKGFGQGNFQALFEAIEVDQRRRGNLLRSSK